MADINQIKIGGTTYDINDERISSIATSVASGNSNPVSSGAVYAALQNAGGGSSDNELIVTRDYDDGDYIDNSDEYNLLCHVPFINIPGWGCLFKHCVECNPDVASAIESQVESEYQAMEIDWIGMEVQNRFDPACGGPSEDVGYACLVLFIDGDNEWRVAILEV